MKHPNAYKNDGTPCPKCRSKRGTFQHNQYAEKVGTVWYGCDNCGAHFTKSYPAKVAR